ncbi:MAG: transcription elongation factor GreB [Rhodospirillales bacterium]|nr:transcription elongation factor GreB [Rhodospirillales bacterium]
MNHKPPPPPDLAPPDCITPEGHARLKAELTQLWENERPEVVRTVHWAAGNGDRSENGDYIYGKKRLRQIDSRVRFLRKRLENLSVVDPRFQVDRERIHFGATVRYERANGKIMTVTLIGSDETEPSLGRISTDSPIGAALLHKTVGDLVIVDTPSGEDELKILGISYPER